MAKPLTVRGIEALKPQDKRLELPDGSAPGLYLVVQPSGVMSWSFRYRSPITGKPKKFTIGTYPTFSLATARETANDLRQDIRRGTDPAEDRRAAKARAADVTRDVDALLTRFIKHHVGAKKASTSRLMKQQIETELRPAWGKRRIETITRADVKALVNGILDRGAPVQANRVFSLARLFLRWCVDEAEVIEQSPAIGMRKPADEGTRDRVLSNDELRWFWRATGRAGRFGVCARLLLLTGQRRMEVGGMEWPELALDASTPLWTIPPARVKNGSEHAVPLSQAAVGELASLSPVNASRFVFTTDGEVPSAGWSKSKAVLDALMLEEARSEAESEGKKPIEALTPWTLHDLRRTCATGLASLRQSPHVIEAVLNHRTGIVRGVARTYNRFEYLDEKQHALTAWASYVLAAADRSSPHVVSLADHRRSI
ncbi:site-specific integrase [Devosia sp. SD17-2]|uniref:tyrosine-type recombinase/integrase n=1 Tax=Devosia sp. SD17-2 TaxID=2976459 RepID=UPI0023D8AE25|nr:site-specific integrase [Devosia sp. SD17-2]WEJ32003.1 integrase arm-type DNA-binding domain-containing protein [Devosia sp. SD17-2]